MNEINAILKSDRFVSLFSSDFSDFTERVRPNSVQFGVRILTIRIKKKRNRPRTGLVSRCTRKIVKTILQEKSKSPFRLLHYFIIFSLKA